MVGFSEIGQTIGQLIYRGLWWIFAVRESSANYLKIQYVIADRRRIRRRQRRGILINIPPWSRIIMPRNSRARELCSPTLSTRAFHSYPSTLECKTRFCARISAYSSTLGVRLIFNHFCQSLSSVSAFKYLSEFFFFTTNQISWKQ